MIRETNINELKLLSRGKVRDIYELDENLLIVTTDRVSAFDYVLHEIIPFKGIVLNKLALFFFEKTEHIIENHIEYYDFDSLPNYLKKYEYLKDRFVVVKKAKTLPVECIVRGYITGSAWSEYVKTQTIGGMYVESGLVESEKFPDDIFTPSTKAESGMHDENISFDRMKEILGHQLAEDVKTVSLSLFSYASEFLENRGIIMADTKFEFGMMGDKLLLIDEIFTPDSSRFWFKSKYTAGTKQESLDKQFIRNFLLSTGWDRNSSPPHLTEEVVNETSNIYKTIYKLITDDEIS